MEKITMNPFLIRFTLWLAGSILAASALVFCSGGFAQVLEYLNDLF
jgi:hypothetical protein